MRGLDRLLASVHPDDRARVAAIVEGPADGRQPEPAEYRCIKPSGEEVWVRDACAVVTTDGDRRLLQGLLFDITAAKRAEADRDRLELDLRLGQKLEAVGQLAAGIAHEINTPTQFVGDTVRFLDDAFGDAHALVVAYERLLAAAEAGPVRRELIAARPRRPRSRRPRLPARARARRLRARHRRRAAGRPPSSRAMREFAHPPTTDKVPVDINQALRSTLVVACNEYKYVAEVRRSSASCRRSSATAATSTRSSSTSSSTRPTRSRTSAAEGERGTIRAAHDGRGRPRAHQRQRHRPRHPVRRRRAHLRPVLHHQGRRARHRPGPRDRATDRRRAPRRHAQLRDRAGPRHHVPRPAAGRRAGQHPRETQVAA